MEREEFKNEKGNTIGNLFNGIYRKKVQRSKHLFKKLNGWGIDKPVLEKLQQKGCKEIRILDTERDIIYSCPRDMFMTNGVYIHYDGPQIVLSLHYFSTNKKS